MRPTPSAMRGVLLASIVLSLPLLFGPAVTAHDVDCEPEAGCTAYTQTYHVAGAGVVTVVCPSPERDIGMWGDCVPTDHSEGVPPDQQMWIGGAGIDIPATSVPFHVAVDDATGTPVAGAVCVDHDMDNLCASADPCWGNADPAAPACPREGTDPMHVEQVIYFCGEVDIPNTFNTDPMGMPFRHIDVWVRFVGNLQRVVFQDESAPLCTALPEPAGQGGLGVGSRGTATIYALD